MGCSNVIDLGIKTRRHVGGILNSNAKFICRLVYNVILLSRVCKHIRCLTTIQYCNIVYLQHGGGNYCTQNDVTVAPCIAQKEKGENN